MIERGARGVRFTIESSPYFQSAVGLSELRLSGPRWPWFSWILSESPLHRWIRVVGPGLGYPRRLEK